MKTAYIVAPYRSAVGKAYRGSLAKHRPDNLCADVIQGVLQKAGAFPHEHIEDVIVGCANLMYMLELIKKGDFKGVDTMLRSFQGTMQMIKYAPFPSISCPYSMTLGGGCEVTLHTSWRMVAGETYSGLVEAGVGLIPAGGGTKELALRAYDLASQGEKVDPMAYLYKAFMLIGMAQVSTSGHDCIENGLYPKTTMVSLSQDHQVIKAKSFIKEIARQGYMPPWQTLLCKHSATTAFRHSRWLFTI